MTIGYTDLQHYGDIAAAIRTKGGATGQLTPAQMAAAIANIPSGSGGGDIDAMIARTLSGDITTNVTAIGAQGLAQLPGLTSVDAPNVTSVGDYGFSGCSALTSINFQNAVTSLGVGAFENCAQMQSVNFPNVTSLSNYLFRGCTQLTSVDAPNVTSVGDYGFSGCSALTSINFQNAVTSLGAGAFERCAQLQSVNFPNVTRLSNYLFRSCTQLASVSMEGATGGADATYAFQSCINLSSVNLPNQTVGGMQMFTGCKSLTDVSLPSVLSVGSNMFAMDSNGAKFLSANLPSCTKVATGAFRIKPTSVSMDNWLYADRGVLLGTGVTSIASSATNPTFQGLEYVILLATTPPTLSNAYTFTTARAGGYADYATEGMTRKQSARTGSNVQSYPGVFYVPDSAVSTYKSKTNWSSQNILPIGNCPYRIRDIYPYFSS